jgi:hypothetical protein
MKVNINDPEIRIKAIKLKNIVFERHDVSLEYSIALDWIAEYYRLGKNFHTSYRNIYGYDRLCLATWEVCDPEIFNSKLCRALA